jgi:heme a synthase
MTRSTNNPWLHRFAVFTALATLALLGVGGVVTSKGVGMAVPDWPTTYGYNMFFFPFSKWTGGIFYEHAHRLVASGVGLLTTILAVWLWIAESRRWLRWLGVIAFFAVVFQGVLGGLRVVLFKDEIGIFHATLAQLFFATTSAIALFTSRWWVGKAGSPVPTDGAHGVMHPADDGLRQSLLVTTILIFLQLVLGATMRHQHAGLAIPDFPLAYGKLWPAMDANAVANYNAQRVEVTAKNAITATQIALQLAHRGMALLILGSVMFCAWRSHRSTAEIRRVMTVWVALILVQIALGAWTIWSNKAADIATAHVMVGALSLVTGVLGCIISYRRFTGNERSTAVIFSESAAARPISV